MPSISIPLDDYTISRLTEEAIKNGKSTEFYIREWLQAHVKMLDCCML